MQCFVIFKSHFSETLLVADKNYAYIFMLIFRNKKWNINYALTIENTKFIEINAFDIENL